MVAEFLEDSIVTCQICRMSSTTHAANLKTKKDFAPGQYLFREGDPSNSMFLVQKGTVSIRKVKGQAYIELGRVYANEVLGELSFFDRQPRSAAAIALTDVEVLEIRFDALDKVYAGIPDYMKTIMASVADRLRKANDTIRRLQKTLVKDSDSPGPGPVSGAPSLDEEESDPTDDPSGA